MPDLNLKDFSINWVLFGLLFFCMITFSISFMFYNNPIGLGDADDIFEDAQTNVQGKLRSLPEESNALLNITAETNPEVSDLGSRDSVATSYGITGSSKGFFESSKIFMGWVLVGTTGELLIGVFGGLFSLTGLYFITKWIRNGI